MEHHYCLSERVLASWPLQEHPIYSLPQPWPGGQAAVLRRAPETDTASPAGDNFGEPDDAVVELEAGDFEEHDAVLDCGDESALVKFVCFPCGMNFRYVEALAY